MPGNVGRGRRASADWRRTGCVGGGMSKGWRWSAGSRGSLGRKRWLINRIGAAARSNAAYQKQQYLKEYNSATGPDWLYFRRFLGGNQFA